MFFSNKVARLPMDAVLTDSPIVETAITVLRVKTWTSSFTHYSLPLPPNTGWRGSTTKPDSNNEQEQGEDIENIIA